MIASTQVNTPRYSENIKSFDETTKIRSHQTLLDYFVSPTRAPVTDYFITKVNNLLQDNLISPELNYQKKIAVLKALIETNSEILTQIGLKIVAPPSHIHSTDFGKGKLGDFHCPDMIVDCWQRFDVLPASGEKVLDFGCSSGRVIRNFQSFLPDVQWYGCDPRQSSIDWAQETFPEINFFCSNEEPPLNNFSDSSLAGAYAISVWSHFSKPLALRWFEEMARIIKTNGFLIFTTHGFRSVKHCTKIKKSMPQARGDERLLSLIKGQYHFRPYPNNLSALDGLNTSNWGVTYADITWYENNLSSHWEIMEHLPGRLLANQDMYMLRRR